MKIKFHQTLTSKEGCAVTIDGTITLNWGSFEGFSGTMTLSGGSGCPTGTLTFGYPIHGGDSGKDVNILFNSRKIWNVSKIFWTKGKEKVPEILNDKEIENGLLEELTFIASGLRKKKEKKTKKRGEVVVNVTVNCNCDKN
jgi:hypothetical protein